MKNPINKLSEDLLNKEAKYIDKIIFSNIPKWKAKILKAIPLRFMAKILNVNITIEKVNLINELGYRKTVFLNDNPIGHVKSVIDLSDE